MSRSMRCLPLLLLIAATDALATTPLWPQIEYVSPPIGRPSGGQTVFISGRNFESAVRVFFTSGSGETMDARVTFVTPRWIEIVTPPFELPAGKQSVPVEITVVTRAGLKESRANAFAFRNEILTPFIYGVWPDTAPSTGGTALRLMGEGFQIPIRAFLLYEDVTTELHVVRGDYGEVEIQIPPAGDVPLDKPLDVRVENVGSSTQSVFRDAFRYIPPPMIETMTPNRGSRFGGTRIVVEGTALFGDYVSVEVAGVGATPTLVTPTRIEAMTSPIYDSPCDDVAGPVIVRHFNGAMVIGPEFTYVTRKKSIERVPEEPVIAGSSADLVLADDSGIPRRFTIGGIEVTPIGSRPHSVAGLTAWTLPVPANLAFPREVCFVDGERGMRLGQQTFDVVVRTETAGCQWDDTARIAVQPASAPCTIHPRPPALPKR